MGDNGKKRIAVIVNGRSGNEKDEAMLGELDEIFRKYGISARIQIANQGERIIDLAKRALEDGYRIIVAGGGDGTINAVASVAMGNQDVTVGVLPLGTLNHFAKDLGIPLDLNDAVRGIASGEVVQVDVGEVNGKIFLNNSSIGLYPSIVRKREAQERLGRGKWSALVRATLTMLGRYPVLAVRIKSDDKEIVTRTPMVFIGNNEYSMEGFNLGTRPHLNGGCLSLYTLRHHRKFSFLGLAARAIIGNLDDTDDFEIMNVKELDIEVNRSRLSVARDGEVGQMDTPLHYRCHPEALRVMVPREVAEKVRADNANPTCVIGRQEAVTRPLKDAVAKG